MRCGRSRCRTTRIESVNAVMGERSCDRWLKGVAMAFCPNCGTAVAADSAFCGNCGQPTKPGAVATVAQAVAAPAQAAAIPAQTNAGAAGLTSNMAGALAYIL